DIQMSMLETLFGSGYQMEQLFVDPADLGHTAVARHRTYIYIWPKHLTEYLHDVHELYAKISQKIGKVVRTRASDYMVTGVFPRMLQELELCYRRSIGYRKDSNGSMRYLLTPREEETLRSLDTSYIERFGRHPASDADLFYCLGDNASFSKTWSAVSGKLPTFRRSGGVMLQRSTETVMSGCDKLAALGWPVTPEQALNMGCSQMPCRDPRRADQVAGNAMHLSNAALILLLGLACFGP
ncbi:unnamed protein product, partial [Symbiodinium necroappetens]